MTFIGGLNRFKLKQTSHFLNILWRRKIEYEQNDRKMKRRIFKGENENHKNKGHLPVKINTGPWQKIPG